MKNMHITRHLSHAQRLFLQMLLCLYALVQPSALASSPRLSSPPRLLSPLFPDRESLLFEGFHSGQFFGSHNGQFFGILSAAEFEDESKVTRVLVYETATDKLFGDVWVPGSGVKAALGDDGKSLLLMIPNGNTISIQWLDLTTGQPRRPSWQVTSGLEDPVVGLSPGGDRWLVPGGGCTYEFRSAEREQPLTTFEVSCKARVVPTPDLAAVVINGDKPHTLEVYQPLAPRAKPLLLKGSPFTLSSAALSPDGRRLVTTYLYSGKPLLWDLTAGGPPQPLVDAEGLDYRHPPRFSPDGRGLLAIRGRDGAIGWWDLSSPVMAPPRWVIPRDSGLFRDDKIDDSLLVGSPENRLAAYVTAGRIIVVDTASGKWVRKFGLIGMQDVQAAFITPDATRVIPRDSVIPREKDYRFPKSPGPSAHDGLEGLMAWSSDGQLELEVKYDSESRVLVREVHTGIERFSAKLPYDFYVHHGSLTPEGSITLVVSTSNLETDGVSLVLLTWNKESAQWTRKLELDSTWMNKKIVSVRHSPDPNGRFLLLGYETGIIRADLEQGRVLPPLEGMESGPVLAAAFSADGSRVLAAGIQDKTSALFVCEWEHTTGRKLACRSSLRAERAQGFGVFLPSGDRVVINGRILDVATLKPVGQLQEMHPMDVRSSTFSLDGSRMLVVYDGGAIHLFESATGRRLAELFFWRDGWLVLGPDGRFDGSRSSWAAGFSWRSGDEVFPLERFHEQRQELGLLGKLLGGNPSPLLPVDSLEQRPLAPTLDGVVEWQGFDEPRLRFQVRARSGGIGRIRVTLNGAEYLLDLRTVAQACRQHQTGLDCDLSLSSFRNVIPEFWVHIPEGGTRSNSLELEAENAAGTLRSVPFKLEFQAHAWGPEEKKAASVPATDSRPVEGGAAQAMSVEAPKRAPPLRLVAAQGIRSVPGVVVVGPESPGMPRLVLTVHNSVAVLSKADTGEILLRLEGHQAPITAAAFSDDSLRVVTADVAGFIQVWDVTTGAGRVLGRDTTGQDLKVRFLPGAHRVISGSAGGQLILWDVPPPGEEGRKGRPLGELSPGGLSCLRFSPDGRWLLSGDPVGGGTLWDTGTWRRVRMLPALPQTSHPLSGNSTVCHGDGRHLVRGSPSLRHARLVEVWDMVTGRLVRRIEMVKHHHFGGLSPDLQEALIISAYGKMTLWDITRGAPLRILRESNTIRRSFNSYFDRFHFNQGQEDWFFDLAHWRAVRLKLSLDTLMERDPIPDWAEWSEDGRYLVLSQDGYKHLAVYSSSPTAESTPVFTQVSRLNERAMNVLQVSFAPEESSRMLVSTSSGPYLWDAASDSTRIPEQTTEFAGGSKSDPQQTIRLREQLQRKLSAYPGHELEALSPDGSFFVARGRLEPEKELSEIVLAIYDTKTGTRIGYAEGLDAVTLESAFISPDGRFMLASHYSYKDSSFNVRTLLWDLRNPRAPRPIHTFPDWSLSGFSKKGDMLVLGRLNGIVQMWSLESILGEAHERAEPLRVFPVPGSPIPGHTGPIRSLDVSADGRFLITYGADNTTRLWDTRTGLELCKLYSFTDGTWAVIDPSGRYDASNGGEIDGLYWVVNGFETISLSQLKSRYYEPNLLARLMGYSSEPLRDVQRFDDPRLYPDVKARVQGPTNAPALHIELTERGGGIGRTQVAINGKEVLQLSLERSGPESSKSPRVESVAPDAAKDARCERQPGRLTCDIPLKPLFRYFQAHTVRLPGTKTDTAPQRPVNRISVQAYNDEEYLLGKPVTFEYSPPRIGTRGATDVDVPVTEAELVVPRLWAVVAGVSDYTGAGIDLRYAAKDADDFARALDTAARRLLCSAEDLAAGKTCDRVHIRRLSSTAERQDLCLPALTGLASGDRRFTEPEGDGNSCSLKPSQSPCTPDKMNLLRALEELKDARPEDIVVVYLAGHGAASRHGNHEAYHYLTQDAWSLDMSDPELRCGGTLSSETLNEALKKSPATKQVMILDTCNSGAMVLKMTGSRGMSSSQVRAMEQMQDQTGMYVLAGASSDAVSYEAPEFGQGVLTYSLLKGMSAEGLAEESLVDVGRLFEYASKKVPELARGVSRAQQPVIAMPRGGGNFYIGQVTPPEQGIILKHLVQDPRPRFVLPNFFERDEWLDISGVKAAVVSELRDRSGVRQPTLAFVDVPELPGAYQLVGSYRKKGGKRTSATLEVSARVFKDGKQMGCDFRVSVPGVPWATPGRVPTPQESKPLASALVDGALKELERAKSSTSLVCRP
ncbi:caspase family protein [Hyalangium rubrum]|uniref:Caspase family protein n=1 Tax=Hyalangium rubrum TaxID=3103134 RepID=A0ABU5HIP5_9BACT|nr:caspase family protein [Hyalangium sp. s54d21]MDY7233333.1 caspase family protein [Hyalangium sp. s54d21]